MPLLNNFHGLVLHKIELDLLKIDLLTISNQKTLKS